ncbi:hypothetical protein P5673_031468 [Acropora cervicornis]|uniref:Reverse transcriptase n=1 Tax=Acropora cervicornis TaxID=6130 RepID=A0AAD9PST6_ACRCE|nr:hypothetical protein P5673_031468 [Acropora cervicornis]
MANILSKYPAVFDNSVGKLEGELHLYTKQDVTPSKAAPREIPLSVKNKLIAEIKDLQEQGIIEKVTEPTDWVSAPTIVNKPSAKNGLRLCIDSRPLNTALKRSEYPIPTVDQLLTEISNAKHPFRAYDVEVDGKLLRRNRVHLKPAGKPLNLDKRQSAQNPKADVKVRASETKTSSSNSVPSPPKLKSQPTQPVKFAKKMELVVAHRTRSGRPTKRNILASLGDIVDQPLPIEKMKKTYLDLNTAKDMILNRITFCHSRVDVMPKLTTF